MDHIDAITGAKQSLQRRLHRGIIQRAYYANAVDIAVATALDATVLSCERSVSHIDDALIAHMAVVRPRRLWFLALLAVAAPHASYSLSLIHI